jgi:hypothetical protein
MFSEREDKNGLEVMFTDWKNMALASPSNDLVIIQ